MRIAIIMGSDLRNYGGGEKDVIRYSSQLKDKMDITIFSPIGIGEERVSMDKINVLLKGINVVWYNGRKLQLLKDIWTRYRFDLSSFDKVYATAQGFLLNRKILNSGAKKTLLGIHTLGALSDHPVENKLWKRMLYRLIYPLNMHYIKKFDEIRVQNKDDYQRLKEIGYKGAIWNIPPAMFADTPEPVVSDKFYGVWVNRVSPEKRPELLVELAKLLPDIEFHVIGSGFLDEYYEDMCTLHGISNIIFKGFISEEELGKELQSASFYISTSRGENFGMSAVEAMAYGVPTFAFDVIGLRDHCTEVVNTILEMVSCIDSIQATFQTMELSTVFLELKSAIRQQTLNRFADRVVIPQIEEMLRE